MLKFSVQITFILLIGILFRTHGVQIPIGVFVEPGEETQFDVVKYALEQSSFQVKQEIVSSNNVTQLNKAFCRLLKEGIQVLIAPATALSHELLVSYSSEYSLPLISPFFPRVRHNLLCRYCVVIEPDTTMIILALLRHFQWKDVVYLYDNNQGVGKLEDVYERGYSALETNLIGIVKVSKAEEVTKYFQKLEAIRNRHSFNVIIDTDVFLAKDIIQRHIHDTKVGKKGYHFIIAKPVTKQFWSDSATEFGAVTVTGFMTPQNDVKKAYRQLWNVKKEKPWEQIKSANQFYLYHDAASIIRPFSRYMALDDSKLKERNCLEKSTYKFVEGERLSERIRTGITHGLTGNSTQFNSFGERRDAVIQLVEISNSRKHSIGSWSYKNGLNMSRKPIEVLPTQLPQINGKKFYKITSILNPPFLMVAGENATGHKKFYGYCKDLIDILSEEMNFDFEINLVEDSRYGLFNKTTGEWTGMIGEIIRGKADMAIADLHVSARRHPVVDFSDSFLTESLSLLMKDPRFITSTPTASFFFTVFSKDIWICVIVVAAVMICLSYAMFKFIGEPDNIEAASGIWGKKFTFVSTVWFVLGSGLFQETAVYPRSLSSRILGASWWCFSLALFASYIANATTQLYMSNSHSVIESSPELDVLHSLSLESVVKESTTNHWLNIMVRKNGKMHNYIKQSSISFLKDYISHLDKFPALAVNSISEGVEKVRKSSGHEALFMESSNAHYFSKQQPCDTVAIHGDTELFFYAIAVPLESKLRLELNTVIETLASKGILSKLKVKWFQDKSSCNMKLLEHQIKDKNDLLMHSSLFLLLAIGLIVSILVTIGQYFWRARRKEERRHKLSFEEVEIGQTLPLPPPELLRDSAEDEDNRMIENWMERKLIPTSFGARNSSQNEELSSD